jgi:hypothetical protein
VRGGPRATAPMVLVVGEKLSERADEAWKSAGLNRITLHECRHTFGSLVIAAGGNAKA